MLISTWWNITSYYSKIQQAFRTNHGMGQRIHLHTMCICLAGILNDWKDTRHFWSVKEELRRSIGFALHLPPVVVLTASKSNGKITWPVSVGGIPCELHDFSMCAVLHGSGWRFLIHQNRVPLCPLGKEGKKKSEFNKF